MDQHMTMDAEIVDLYWRRDELAIQRTAEHYGALCLRVAMNILGNAADAEECVNDTYLKAWKSIPPWRISRGLRHFSRYRGAACSPISLK